MRPLIVALFDMVMLMSTPEISTLPLWVPKDAGMVMSFPSTVTAFWRAVMVVTVTDWVVLGAVGKITANGIVCADRS